MNFGSFGAGFGSFGAGVGGLLPSFTNITSWLKSPTTDGKTLENSKGTNANLTGVNCLDFDGSGDRIQLNSAGGVNLVTNAGNNLGSCVITVTFKQEVLGTQIVYSNGAAAYRLFTQNNFLKVNSDGTEIFAIEANKVYRSTITYNASGQVTNFVLENLTDGTTQTDSTTRAAGNHTGSSGFQIGARNAGLVWNGKISNFSVSNSSVGANFHYPLSEGSGSVAYDVSGTGANGSIINATHSTLDGIESWNHEYGFDIDGSVKVPALNIKTKQVANFDGVADQLNTGYNPSGDLIIDARIKADTVTGQKIIHQCNENAGYFFRISDGEWQLYVGNGYVFDTSTGIDPAVDTLYDTRVEYTASSNAWVVKVKVATDSTYTTVGSGTRTPAFSSANFILGQKGSSMFFDGEYHSFKITDGGATKVEYDFQSDIGTTTVQDLSTNNNDGTVTTGSGGTATFWGKRIADTAGSLVSADYAAGNLTISNPGGFVHNGSECGVDMVTNDLTSTQLFAIDNSTATQTFVRKDGVNILQILDYSSALTGNDLTRTRNYVG